MQYRCINFQFWIRAKKHRRRKEENGGGHQDNSLKPGFKT
jgi:hypothetical protein